MDSLTLDLPAMYGDHHVMEVRQLLLSLNGVKDVYASSAFHTAEVTFDPALVNADVITTKLDEAGYLGELLVPEETGAPATNGNGDKAFFRHTAAYAAAGKTISFAQNVSYTGRPLWPCPGFGPLKMDEGK